MKGKGDERKLTPKQQAFVDFYIQYGNATEAYKKAYNNKNAKTSGRESARLMADPRISQKIHARMSSKENDRIASQDEVLAFLTSVMRGKVTERVPLLIGNGMQELTENLPPVQVREKAAELLGKRYRLFTDRQEIEGTIGVKVVDDV